MLKLMLNCQLQDLAYHKCVAIYNFVNTLEVADSNG